MNMGLAIIKSSGLSRSSSSQDKTNAIQSRASIFATSGRN